MPDALERHLRQGATVACAKSRPFRYADRRIFADNVCSDSEPCGLARHRNYNGDSGTRWNMVSETSAQELGIDIEDGEGEVFKWFVASFLFGKRIQREIAAEAYRVIVDRHRRDTPRKLGNCSRAELVRMLGQARYVRYDESTAERLLKLCDKLNGEYGGRLGAIREQSESRKELEKRLTEFEGVGPKTVEIFMREAAKVWY